MAIKMYCGRISACGVEKISKTDHFNVINWIKKVLQIEPQKESIQPARVVEFNESYWFFNRKLRTKTHENVYIITMVSRKPR